MTPLSSYRPGPRRIALLYAALLAGALVSSGCGGGDAQLEAAQRFLRRGQLDQAEEALAGTSGNEVDRLRKQIAAGQERLRRVEDEIAACERIDARDAVKRLRALRDDVDEAYLVDRLDFAISASTDRAAEGLGASRAQDRRLQEEAESRTNQEVLRASKNSAREEPAVSHSPAGQAAEASKSEPADEESPSVAETVKAETTKERESAITASTTSRPETIQDAEVAPEPEPATDSFPEAEVAVEEEASEEAVAGVLLAEELTKNERLLSRASAEKRDELWDAMSAHGAAAKPFLTRALTERWGKVQKSLVSGASLKALERVAQDREELDYRRKAALDLIFDEEKYFYPYRPPECPPEKARLYWPVQREVDELVGELRDVWEKPRQAKIAKGFHEDIAELKWCIERSAEYDIELIYTEEIPSWASLILPGTKVLDTHSFAWNESEMRDMHNSRAIRARNVALWERKAQEGFVEEEQAGSEEQRQVEITNDYRAMFGRRSLAWNSLLQAAADGHSDYMAKTGEFGHFEKGDDQRKSPFDRMRLVGYNHGVSENCHMGGGSPQGAHDGWCKSSGHHRNLLMAGHTEMGSAVNGRYWTQNFGTDRAHQSEIDTWQD